MTQSNGTTAAGFEGVREVFEANFAKGLEIGASFSAYHRGRKVVDLWGGTADVDTGRPWDERTLALVFSTTKGATAICANKLAQEGALDVDAPVARYWPEFAAGGKADIPVKFLLSHQAGLAWIDGDMSLAEALSWDPVVDALAQQVPHYEPGSQHGYHATTYGWLVGEVIRRISGKSVGTYFHQEIATPLGLDFWIGLPESEEPRVAPLVGGLADPMITEDPETRAFVEAIMGPDTTLGKALFAPGGALDRPRRVEQPGAARRGGSRGQRDRRRALDSHACTPRVSELSTGSGSSAPTSSTRRRRSSPPGRTRCCSTWTSSSGSDSCCAAGSSSWAGPARSGISARAAPSVGPTPKPSSRSAT